MEEMNHAKEKGSCEKEESSCQEESFPEEDCQEKGCRPVEEKADPSETQVSEESCGETASICHSRYGIAARYYGGGR
jgi:hypothetical protein